MLLALAPLQGAEDGTGGNFNEDFEDFIGTGDSAGPAGDVGTLLHIGEGTGGDFNEDLLLELAPFKGAVNGTVGIFTEEDEDFIFTVDPAYSAGDRGIPLCVEDDFDSFTFTREARSSTETLSSWS